MRRISCGEYQVANRHGGTVPFVSLFTPIRSMSIEVSMACRRSLLLTIVGPVFFLAGDTPASHPMLPAAVAFLESFNTRDQEDLLLPFEDSERTDWSYLPGGRKGIALGDMTDRQRAKAFELTRSTLSDAGYRKTVEVIELEGVLRELERIDSRNPGHYWWTLFGKPFCGGV